MQYLTYLNHAEIADYAMNTLGLNLHLGYDTISQLDFDHLMTLPKRKANAIIMETAEDLMLQSMNGQLQNLFERAGFYPARQYYLVDFILNRVRNFNDIHAAYNNLLAYGFDSPTYMNVLMQIQRLL